MRFKQFRFSLAFVLCGIGAAQGPVQPVEWAGSATATTPLKQGSTFAVDLTADIQAGWHVYGLAQVAGGPTPLRVSLDENDVAQIVGTVSGTAPVKKHNSSFDLETQFYAQSLKLHLPLQVKQHAAISKQTVSVSVRFQACSDQTCLPPRTVHLSIPIEVFPGT
jgi:DsbC/DsbD-like thiol-disulfide interchange protein